VFKGFKVEDVKNTDEDVKNTDEDVKNTDEDVKNTDEDVKNTDEDVRVCLDCLDVSRRFLGAPRTNQRAVTHRGYLGFRV